MADAVLAATEPSVPAPNSVEARVDALSGEARSQYRLTGDLAAAENFGKPAPTNSDAPEKAPAAPSTAPTEQPAAPADEADEAPTEPESGPGEKSQQKPDRQPRDWATLRREHAKLKAQLEFAQGELARSRTSAPAAPETPKLAPPIQTRRPEFPDIDKYETTAAYNAAIRKYEADTEAYFEQKIEAKLGAVETSRQSQTVAKQWSEQEAAATAKYKDFEQVAYNPDTPASLTMIQTLRAHKSGAELAYWLGKNPAEAQRISDLTDFAGTFKSYADIEAAASANPRLAMELGRKLARVELEFEKIAASLDSSQSGPPAVPAGTRPPMKPTSEVSVVPRGTQPVLGAKEAAIRKAAETGDASDYIREQNRLEIQAARTR